MIDFRFLQATETAARSPGPFENFDAAAYFSRTSWVWVLVGAVLAVMVILILCYIMKKLREKVRLASEELGRQERLRELADEKEEQRLMIEQARKLAELNAKMAKANVKRNMKAKT